LIGLVIGIGIMPHVGRQLADVAAEESGHTAARPLLVSRYRQRLPKLRERSGDVQETRAG
jgi:hypothetical protein